MAAGGRCVRSSRELWTIVKGKSALREPAQLAEELNKHCQRLLEGLSYYKPPSASSAEAVKADKNVPAPLKELGLRVSKFLGLDEEQSVQLLQCYLQEDYRGTRDSLKAVLQDERQSQALMLKLADYYYEERICILRCILHLLTYFQDERHPYMLQFSQCVEKMDKELVLNYRKQFEELYKAEAPTWETHGSLMTERQVSRWFVQCLREQSMLLEIIFIYYAYFEMAPEELLAFAKMFKEQGFGSRQTNRHLVDESMDYLVERIGHFSALILVEGMEIDSLHERLLYDRKEEHKFGSGQICQEMDRLLLTLGDVSHHAPVLLAWALLRHTLSSEEATGAIRRMGSTAIQLNVFQYLTKMLRSVRSEGHCISSTACMCTYGLLSFVLTSLELHTLGNQQDIIDTACEVLTASSIPPLFWKTEPTAGLGIILDSVCGMFPHHLSPLLQLLTALVSDKSTAKKVYTFLDKMSFYIELYKHKPADVISHEDGTLWRRLAPKLLYPLGLGQTNLRIPQGTVGQVMIDDRAYLVRWEYSYSSWTLFTCEIEMLLHVVSTADVIQHCRRVKPIIDLVHKVISTDVSIADCLLPITSRIYMLLQRLTTVIAPPVDVIASCVNCLTVLASRMPAKVWTDLHHTGFLPFVANPLSSMSHVISAEGMNAGGYGNLLISIEQPQGEYGVTISFLNLVMTLVRGQLGSTQSQGLVPCVVFVLKEMLPNYHKWRYKSHGVREQIGYLILQLIHAILNLCPEMDPPSSSTPSLQSLCIFSLANTEAGQAVINIMGIGVDTIDVVVAMQSTSEEPQTPRESQGQLLIHTVKLAFSVINNVIRLKPPSSVVSPLEHALTQHGAHRNNLVAVLAKYIYHKHDAALPRLAIQLLKRLATVAPMSVYACLGNDAAAIRDAFLTRLQSKIEDMRVKVMILEFLTVAVETQPGLIELFLNLEVKDGSEGSKEFSLGEWSCLHVILELIDVKQPERYWCPPLLQRAAVAFLHALWQDRRDSAMLVLRTKPKFWGNLTNPLFGTLPAPCETSELSVLDTCALIMKIICLEIYYVVKGSLDQSLTDMLKKFSTEKRFAYWSGYVKSLAFHVAETEGNSCTSMAEYRMLISAWRMMLIVSSSHADIMHLTDSEVRPLFLDVLGGTKALMLVPTSVRCLQLGSMLCTLLLILLRQWKSELGSVDAIVSSLTQILEGVLQADPQLMEKTKAKVFSALITVLQMKHVEVSEIPQYSQLVLSVSETLQEEFIALFDQTRHCLTSGDPVEDKDSMETDDPLRHKQKDQRDGVCVLGLHLAKELCEADEEGDYWLQVTRKVPILPTLFTTLEISLRVKQNLHFTEASLHLLLTLARTQQGAAAIAGAGIMQSICLPLLSVYQLSSNGTGQVPASSRKSLDAPSWPGVYRLSVSLMERLLKTLRYNFLTDALDFVGVHQERILQCLNAVRTVQSLACLEEADHTAGFILQLSNFMKEWHFHLPQLLRDVQVNLCYLCQACTSLLHSRKMLQHYLQTKNGESLPSGVMPRVQRPPQASTKPPSPETEAAEQKALRMVQYSLLKILSKSLAALRHFTPDVCQILLDQSLDLAEYNILFMLSFTTPAFDSDVAPSFGTLLATVNVALNMLGELDKKKEPFTLAVGLATQQEGSKTLRSLLMFTMENCFYLLISQALRYLKDPAVHPRDKQRMKQELSSELSTLLSSLSRYFRRGGPSSPAGGVLPSPQGKSSSSKLGPEGQEPLFQLVQAFVRHVQR
ncbi:nucleoporin NUP188 isoform X1 [Varanus komodoensis]|uniref:nucleoporin NUP188 isoform X1 n=1 Tax=Varanus komodoensis TaxID=61221 RepID=UPI001CF7A503|nr:nucleoporin NUP188 isoform X1 [Varanus komodoensis]